MISVVIPTFKRPDLLLRLLKSIASQTLLPDEVIVIDDCSLMDQEYNSVIDEIRYKLPSLEFISLQVNSGAPVARNTGIKLARNDWIALVDDDDEWLPEKLEKQMELIQNSNVEKLGLVYSWTKAIGQKGQESYDSKVSVKGNAQKALLSTNFIMSASVVVNKEAICESGLFDEAMPSCQDWDMWIRIVLQGYHIDLVEEVLALYHRHGGKSIGLGERAKQGYYLLLTKYWKEILTKTTLTNIAKKTWLYLHVKSARRL